GVDRLQIVLGNHRLRQVHRLQGDRIGGADLPVTAARAGQKRQPVAGARGRNGHQNTVSQASPRPMIAAATTTRYHSTVISHALPVTNRRRPAPAGSAPLSIVAATVCTKNGIITAHTSRQY